MNQIVKNPPASAPSGRIEEERQRRRRREDTGLGRMRNLAISGATDPRYTYRWINDDPGRVHNLTKLDDWDMVTEGDLGERDAKDKGLGSSTVERIVDKASGKRAVLVRKLKEHDEADQRKKQADLDELESALRAGYTKGEGVSSERTRDGAPAGYIPTGGIKMIDGRRT